MAKNSAILSAVPCLLDFPFYTDFKLIDLDVADKDYFTLSYSNSKTTIFIALTKTSILEIVEYADSVVNLNELAELIQDGLTEPSLVKKYKIINELDENQKELSDLGALRRIELSQIVNEMVDKLSEIDSKVIQDEFNELINGTLDEMSIDEYDYNFLYSVLTFRLATYKVMLGIIIASKISI